MLAPSSCARGSCRRTPAPVPTPRRCREHRLRQQLTDQTPRPAPSAIRSAISLCRADARAEAGSRCSPRPTASGTRPRPPAPQACETGRYAILQRTEVRTERFGVDRVRPRCRLADAIDSRCVSTAAVVRSIPVSPADHGQRVPFDLFQAQRKGRNRSAGRPGENVPPKSTTGSTPTIVTGAPSR